MDNHADNSEEKEAVLTWASLLNVGDKVEKAALVYTVRASHLTANGMVVLTLKEQGGDRVITTAPLPKMVSIKEVGK